MPSEFDLIARYFTRPTPQAALGPGDDCALLVPSPGMELAVTTDMLVAGTHFFADTDPWQLGWKTLAVNVSDLAAMGSCPRWALLAGSLPSADETWLAAFADGFFACARRYEVDLVGGDTTRGPLCLCVTAMGEVPTGTALRRDRALPGDDIWVSGHPGLAALGLAHLMRQTVLSVELAGTCVSVLQRPLPRVELGIALREGGLAHAAIDVSDGLLADLGHIAERSAVDADVFVAQLPALPAGADAALARQCQLSGGDDYELAFTACAKNREALEALALRIGLPLWRIGTVGPRVRTGRVGGVRLISEGGEAIAPGKTGFDHFRTNGKE